MQPFRVQVAVKFNVVEAEVFTFMDAPVAPVDQFTVPVHPVAEIVAMPPTQTEVADDEIVGAFGIVLTFKLCDKLCKLEQLFDVQVAL
jgi:hypothetical protein